MKNIIFITIKELVRIHKGQIEEYGGIYGIRDWQLLESALSSPRATFDNAYLHKNLYEMAAAYAYHIIKNHPFLDGNKRIGIITSLIFLKRNGINAKFKKNELYKLSMQIATTNISKIEISNLFKSRSVSN